MKEGHAVTLVKADYFAKASSFAQGFGGHVVWQAIFFKGMVMNINKH
jgi:hypothetical protein